jgi:Xaa-Pro aminopeptidase
MHHAHRERLRERLRERRAAAVVFTTEPRLRNADSEHRFRPSSDFWYLTGFDEPGAVLVLRPEPDPAVADGACSILFVRPKDREAEVWSGRRLGVEAAPAALGVDVAYPIEELWQRLPALVAGHERVVYRTGEDEARDRRMLDVWERLRRGARSGKPAPRELEDPAHTLHEARLVKGADELERMRRAAAITREAHLAAMRAARPGVNEREIDALLEYTFRRRGATGAAYTNIVAGGANACVLHYVENRAPLRDGDLVLVDAGAEWSWYASDVTRTFPVNGHFGAEQRALYELVLATQERCIGAVRPGTTMQAVHELALRGLVEGLVRLGLVAGPLEQALAEGRWRRFYMHKTSHWLGLDVHDCGASTLDGAPRELVPGMVLTVEPGLYVAPDDETVEARWRGIGVRIEDDVHVTADGREVLTAGIPKSVADVEAACARAEPAAAPA